MRKFLAIALLVLGILGLAGGIFARAQLGAASSVAVAANTATAGAYVVLEPGIMTSGDGKPALLNIKGDAATTYGIFVGMKSDVDAFVGDAKFAQIKTLDNWDTAPIVDANAGGPATGLNPQAADIWIATYQGTGSFSTQLEALDPSLGPVSVLIAADGAKPAPAALTLGWNLPVDATWTVILMGLGLVLIIVALIMGQQAKRVASEARREAEHARKLQEAAAKASVFDEALVVASEQEAAEESLEPSSRATDDNSAPRKREGLR